MGCTFISAALSLSPAPSPCTPLESSTTHPAAPPVQVTAKPGYSWRVGVHPPLLQPLSEITEMERLVRDRSIRPALMMVGATELCH